MRTLSVLSAAVISALSGGSQVQAFDPTAPANVYDLNPAQSPLPSERLLENLFDSPFLEGAGVIITDSKYCPGCEHSLADRTLTNDFLYSPGEPELAEANAYYHIDRYRAYVMNELGFDFSGQFFSISDPLEVDAHAVDGAGDVVGAFYTSRTLGPGSIQVGDRHTIDADGDWISETEVDKELALSADVLVHEFAHAVTDSLLDLFQYNALPPFLREGWADYLMASFLGNTHVGEWADQDSFRGYRRSLEQGIVADDFLPLDNFRAADGISDADYLNARLYYNSMAWSGVLWRLRERIAWIAGDTAPDEASAAVLTDRLVMLGVQHFVDSTGSVDDPALEIADAIAALKSALTDLQGRATTDSDDRSP